MRRTEVYIVSLGASTPVGRDAWSSAAAVRAGITGFAEHPFMTDVEGEPLRVAYAPWLDIALQGIPRFESLLVPAIAEALAPLHSARGSGLRVALVVGLPAQRRGVGAEFGAALRARVLERFPSAFHSIAIFESGHAAPIVGTYGALRKITEGAFDACVISGVDSYISPATLEWIEDNEQFHGAGPLNNAWGFIPGEAAGAVLIASAAGLERLAVEPLARVLSVGAGFEPNRIKTDAVCIGDGLTAAFREGLSGLPSGARVTDVFCDMNGEPYRADEFGFACLRTRELFVSPSDFIAPADCWGDVSSASGPLGLLLACVAARKRYANGPYSLVWASSESGERGAVLLEAAPTAG